MWLQVLGPVRGRRGGVDLVLGPPQQRTQLAVLIAAAGEPVSVAKLSDVLWSGAPSSGSAIVHRYISQLRRILEPDRAARDPAAVIRRTAGGYQLMVDKDSADLMRWRALVAAAQRSAARGDQEAAVRAYEEALGLWDGPASADLAPEARKHPVFATLDREHVAVLIEAADLALAGDQGGRLVPVLDRAVAWHPYEEGLQARLLRALAAAGRRADALRRFAAIRERLRADLGREPDEPLRQAHRLILLEPEALPVGRIMAGVPGPSPLAQPAQLPADLRFFSGRDDELDRLGDILGVPMPLVVVAGLGGVGKTSLALRWAHRVRGQFPDGQLYVDLRGFAPRNQPIDAAEALHGFLEALGVPRAKQPSAPESLEALYRSVLAGRRVLVVLDNARDVDQVRPLLPGTSGCAVIVTSRAYLSGLVVEEGAEFVGLDVFSSPDSYRYLQSRLGDDRLAAEPVAAAEIVEVCGGLPLALAICAAWIQRSPAYTLAAAAEEIRRRQGLDAFAGVANERDVRAVFSWSYRQLSPAAAELFRRLGRHPGSDLALATAASIAGRSRPETLSLLVELTNAQLLTELLPGRYGAHELVRAYAAELSDEVEERETVRRAVEHYLHSLIEAAKLFDPSRGQVRMEPPVAGVTPWHPSNGAQAASWFAAEQDNIRAAFEVAERAGLDVLLWFFSWGMNGMLMQLGRWDEAPPIIERALAAAERHGQMWWRGYLTNALGVCYSELGEYDRASRQFELAAALGRESGDVVRTAAGLLGMAAVLFSRSAWPTAADAERAAELAGEARDLCVEVVRGEGQSRLDLRTTRAHQILGDYREFTAMLVLERTGDAQAGIAELQHGILVHQRNGDRSREGWLWEVQGWILEHHADYAGAVRAYEMAVALLDFDGWSEARNLIAVARCTARLGNLDASAVARARARLDGNYSAQAEQWRAQLDALETGDAAGWDVPGGPPTKR